MCGDQVLGADEVLPALDEGFLKFVQGRDKGVGRCLADQGPEFLGGLQFGRVRREKVRVDTCGPNDVLARMEAGPIEHQNDAIRFTRTDRISKVLECDAERRRVHRGQEQTLHIASRWANKAIDVDPFVSVMLPSNGPHAPGGPDAPGRWLQAYARLVLRPEREGRPGEELADDVDDCGEVFLYVTWSSMFADPC